MAIRKYKRIKSIEGAGDLIGQAAHVIDHLAEMSVEKGSIRGLESASALLIELAKFYIDGVAEEDSGDLTTETEISEQEERPTMGFVKPQEMKN